MRFFSCGHYVTSTSALAETCTYKTWTWDTLQRKSVGHENIVKPRSQLNEHERGSVNDCSVCEEDQVEIRIKTHLAIKICRVFAPAVRDALERAMDAGFPIASVSGYRSWKIKRPGKCLWIADRV